MKKNNRTVVLTFARMNPPTIGHQKLIESMSVIAKQYNVEPRIYLSHKQDKNKNPLSYEQKCKWVSKSFSNIATVKRTSSRDIIEVLKELSLNQIEKVIMVVGSDRKSEFERLTKKYNGIEYNIHEIIIYSPSELLRVDRGISSTLLRTLVVENKQKKFLEGLPTRIRTKDKKRLFKEVKIGLI